MKKQYTSYELMQIVNQIFTDTNNDFSFKVVNADSEEIEVESIIDYLDINFYTYKKDLKEILESDDTELLNHYILSLNENMQKSFGLVEVNSNTPLSAYDINGGNVDGRITILIPVDKVSNFEYFLTTIRNKYIGLFEDLTSDGIDYTSHIIFGNLDYNTEPFECVLGQCVIVSFNISIAYMEKCNTYQDDKVEVMISEDGDEETYWDFPFSKATETIIYNGKSVIKANRPECSGVINASATFTWAFTFWVNANNDFINVLEEIINVTSSTWIYDIEDESYSSVEDVPVNIPIWIRKTSNGKIYYRKTFLTQYQKNYVNNDFTIGTIILTSSAK